MANSKPGSAGNSVDRVRKLIAAYKSYTNYADGSPYDEVLLEVQAAVERSGSVGKVNRPGSGGDSGYWISTRCWSVRLAS